MVYPPRLHPIGDRWGCNQLGCNTGATWVQLTCNGVQVESNLPPRGGRCNLGFFSHTIVI